MLFRSSNTTLPSTFIFFDGRASPKQFLVIALCVLFNMVDGFDITAMAIVASGVATDLDLSADRLGLTFSFALAGMMAGAMGLAPLSDIIGRRKLIVASLLLIGVSIMLTANANTLTEFIALRFVSGLGGGALLAALTIDLVATALARGHFTPLAAGSIVGGLLFIGLNEVVNDYGGFLRKASTTITYLKDRELKARRRELTGKVTFRRSFDLGSGVDVDKIGARLENGILTVTVPKSEKAVPRRIEVK